MTDQAQCTRLTLQIERDVVAQAQLKALLVVADATVAEHRQELRNLKARMARRSPEPERSK